MSLVLRVLELALVVPLTLFGALLLVAGDRVRGWAPWMGYPQGWPFRPVGGLCVALGAFVSWQTITVGIRWDAVLILYVAVGVTIVSLARRARRSA